MKIKNIIICAMAGFVVASCSKMNDLHDKYLDNEIVYAAKVDSVGFQAGKNRALLNLDVRSQRINFVRIFWNNYSDSVDVAVGSQVGIFPKMLENMTENSHLFQLVSYDKFGNPSLPFEASGEVYGDRFQSKLSNRSTQSIFADDEGLTVKWSDAPENSVSAELSYTGKDGKEHIVRILPAENTTLASDWSDGMRYRTLFLPEATAIDTFYTDWRVIANVPFKYSTAGWTATCRDGNHDWGAAGGQPDKVLDGDITTGWHTRVGSSMPQCLIVDMQESRLVDHLVIKFQPNAIANNWIYIKNMEVYLTDTPVTPDVYQSSWGSPVAKYLYPGGVETFTVPLNANSRGRYLVLYFLDSSSNTYISFTELEVYK